MYSPSNSKLYVKGLRTVVGQKGYSGRVAIFEVFEMTHKLSEAVNANINEKIILEEAKNQGMLNLRQDGIIKALKGLVSIEDVLGLVEEGLVGVSDYGNRMEFWWNPEAVYAQSGNEASVSAQSSALIPGTDCLN